MRIAVTKILARKGRLDIGINYVLNGDKTEECVLTAHLNCDPGRECRQMLDTKRAYGKLDGVQYYHVIQSFKPGEVSPELALDIAKAFAQEHLPGYETVIAVHVDKQHIHAHLIFNSVNADTGEKYHSNSQTYYSQIRAVSDRLCREHGLSVVMTGQEMTAFETRTEDTLASLTKQRTILNVRKKKRKKLYDALADVAALAPAAQLYGDGLSGMEAEFARHMDAVDTLERCPIPRERLTAEKADVYRQLAELNRQIRVERKKLALCREIQENLPRMEQEINQIEPKEMIRDDHRRR